MTLYLGNNLISGVATPTEPTRNLGQIIESIVPLTDAGLHLLDGALIQGSGIYSAFVDAIADLVTDYPDLFETEANWQTAVSTYGVCGKFVYDDVNNTVRLPKVTGILEGTTDATALGDLVQAGLPNITGTIYYSRDISYGATPTLISSWSESQSAMSNQPGKSGEFTSVRSGYGTVDVSRVNSIYGNSTTVQPQTIKCYYYIVIATSTKTEIEVDIDQVTTDLNGKADVDLTNVNNSGTSLGAGWAMPSDTYDDLTLGASGTSYTAPANGYIYINKSTSASNQDITITVGNSDSSSDNYSVKSSNPVSGNRTIVFAPVKKGQTFWITYSTAGATNAFRFYYAVGSESEAS